jgi:hypothetical protein
MKRPRFFVGCAMLLGLIVLSAPASPALDLTGVWTGSIDTGSLGQWTLTLVLKKAGPSYTGILNDSLSMIEKDSVIEDVKLTDNEFSFLANVMGNKIELKLKIDGDKMTGKMIDKTTDESKPFEFVRKK